MWSSWKNTYKTDTWRYHVTKGKKKLICDLAAQVWEFMSKLTLSMIQIKNNDLTRFSNMNEYAKDFNDNWQDYVNWL